MKRITLFAVAIIVGFLLVNTAGASGLYPKGIEIFTVNGETYILAPNGNIIHVCPCASCRVPVTLEQPTTCQEDEPCWNCETMGNGVCGPTQEPTAEPTAEPTQAPTVEPAVEPTNEPVPTEKPKCNKGSGNGSEGCDPGNHPERGHDDE